ncbi:MAG: hypothetical protein ACR2NW_03365 [Thermodesulfobacteriota bacterium]
MSNTPSNIVNSEHKPLSVTDWIIVFLLICLPILGIILVIYWSFGDNINVNKKNFSKAMLIFFVFAFLLAIIFAILFGQLFSTLNPQFKLYNF